MAERSKLLKLMKMGLMNPKKSVAKLEKNMLLVAALMTKLLALQKHLKPNLAEELIK